MQTIKTTGGPCAAYEFKIDPFSQEGDRFQPSIVVRKPIVDKKKPPYQRFDNAIIDCDSLSNLTVEGAIKLIDGLQIAIEKAKEFDREYKKGEGAWVS